MDEAEVPAAPRRLFKEPAQCAALHGRMLAAQRGEHDLALSLFLARQIGPDFFELLLEVIAVGARDLWIARLLQIRQHLESQHIARAIGEVVRRVVAWLEAARPAVGEDVRAPRKEQRADLLSLARLHGREAVEPRAAQDAHEHRLGLVVGVMSRREDVRADARHRLPEECVAQFARCKLYRLALRARSRGHIAVPDETRHAALLAERSDE